MEAVMVVKDFLRMMAFFIAFSLISGNAFAADLIKERMLSRVPELNALKAKGVLGENNKGYLEFVGGQKEKVSVVEGENDDRRQVYEAIAKQQNTAPDLVGQRRALQIAESAESGNWLQAADGSWQKK